MPSKNSDSSKIGVTSETEEQHRLNSFRLVFDEHGRVPSEMKLFQTRAAEKCVAEDIVSAALRECERMYENAEDMDASFWMPALASPCSVLEHLAQSIFNLHTAGISHDVSSSGAEWWFVVREPTALNTLERPVGSKASLLNADDVEHGGGELGIDMHFDKDVVLAGLGLPYVHPQLSTVTYLTSYGAPTVITPVRRSTDGKMDELCNGNVVVSHPISGKHLAFDGRYLHGVPEVLNRTASGAATEGRRVTLLVNVWLNHRPFAVQRFPFADIPSARTKLPPNATFSETIASTLAKSGLSAPQSHTIRDIGPNFVGKTQSIQFPIRIDKIGFEDDGEEDGEEEADIFTLTIAQLPTLAEFQSQNETASTFELCFEGGHEPAIHRECELTNPVPEECSPRQKKQRK